MAKNNPETAINILERHGIDVYKEEEELVILAKIASAVAYRLECFTEGQ